MPMLCTCIFQRLSTRYFPGYSLARRLGLSTLILSRITGCIFINKNSAKRDDKQERGNRVNIGLNLKNNRTGQEVDITSGKLYKSNHFCKTLLHVCAMFKSTLFDKSFKKSFFLENSFSEIFFGEKFLFVHNMSSEKHFTTSSEIRARFLFTKVENGPDM
jgi:hypothetical protein